MKKVFTGIMDLATFVVSLAMLCDGISEERMKQALLAMFAMFLMVFNLLCIFDD